MEMLPKTGEYAFMAPPFHCDQHETLFMGHLGNDMLNAADFHSNERGFGTHYLQTIHHTWVLARLAIEMERMPKAYDKFTIRTWADDIKRYFTSRNFEVRAEDGTLLGAARSTWAMIDTETRKPADIFAINDGFIINYLEPVPSTIAPLARVKLPADAEDAGSILTHYSDVDINGHINSIKYVDHLLDLWPAAWHAQHAVRRMEISYVAEAHGGDTLAFRRKQTADGEWLVGISRRTASGDEAECCRCKVIFD